MCEIRHEKILIQALLDDVFSTCGSADPERLQCLCVQRLEDHYGTECPPACLERCAETYIATRLASMASQTAASCPVRGAAMSVSA